MKCSHSGCNEEAAYCIEWWGENQLFGEPELADERHSCANSEHLLALSHHDAYGGYPDEIYSMKTWEKQEELMRAVNDGLDGDSSGIAKIVKDTQSLKGQMRLL